MNHGVIANIILEIEEQDLIKFAEIDLILPEFRNC